MRRIRAFETRPKSPARAVSAPGAWRRRPSRRWCAGRCTCPPGRRRWPPACALNLVREDLLTSTHRGHGHTLAKGADPTRMMASCSAAPRLQQGQGRLDAHRRLLGRHAGRQRRGGRRHPHCHRRRACAEDPRPAAPGGLLLRRRRGQPRPLPGRPELGPGLPAAGAVRVRGQPLSATTPTGADDGRRRRVGARARLAIAGVRSTATT
jgi:hypothetical protein